MANNLTPKQEAFCLAYIELSNASEAYRKAYNASKMKDTTVHVKASELLKNGKVAARVAELQAMHVERHAITVDKVLAEYGKLAFSNPLDYVTVGPDGLAYVNLRNITRDQAAALTEITCEQMPARHNDDGELVPVLKTRVKLADKRAALDSIGKHLGMFKNINEHTGKDGGPIEVVETSAKDAFISRIASLTARSTKNGTDRGAH